MTMGARPIGDGELHAYADGWLDGERRLEVEALLAHDPEAAARVRAYRAQTDALHALYDPVLAEPLDEHGADLCDRLAASLAGDARKLRTRLASPWVRMAAAVLLIVVGGIGGWALRGGEVRTAAPGPLQVFAAEAVQAHAFYTASRFAVEMGADDPGALDTWLSQRLGRVIFGPDLSGLGYRLIGGRSLPTATGAGVQYMYEAEADGRLTLFVSVPDGDQAAAFSYVRQGDISMFYWIEGALAYALIGKVEREELMAIAQAVHREFQRRDPPAGTRRAVVASPTRGDVPVQGPAGPAMQPVGTGTSKPM
jgi:anti-sigma factor RsiW